MITSSHDFFWSSNAKQREVVLERRKTRVMSRCGPHVLLSHDLCRDREWRQRGEEEVLLLPTDILDEHRTHGLPGWPVDKKEDDCP